MSTLERLIQGLNVQTVGDQINVANFPEPDRKDAKEYRIFSFPAATTPTVIEAMEKEGYEPADMYDLLHWGQENWNGQDFVIALDSQYSYQMANKKFPPIPSVPALLYRGSTKGRSLALDALMQQWGKRANFLAVKRSK